MTGNIPISQVKNGEKDGNDINDSTPGKLVDDVWTPLPVTDELADFLALGSRLPGEVRITFARLNVNNLRPVKLIRTPIGDGPDFKVDVSKEGVEPSSLKPMTPWLKHEDSPFHDVKSTDIEKKLDSCIKRDETLLDSRKQRRLVHPLMPDAPMVPYRPKENYNSSDEGDSDFERI